MPTTSSDNSNYIPKTSEINTDDTASYQQKSWYDKISVWIEHTPVAKLYLVLSMIIYGVSVYSKGKGGMQQSDVVLLMFFSLFTILSIIFLDFATFLYRQLLKEGNLETHENVFILLRIVFAKYILPTFVSLALFVLMSLLFFYSGKIIVSLLRSLDLLLK